MKVSFPFMGPTFVYRSVLEQMGHEVIFPNRPSRQTIELGTAYAPEFACFPLKVLMGSYLESIERGAHLIVTSGGVGPCRAGWYGSLHQRILEDIGNQVEFIIFEPSWTKLRAQVSALKGNTPWLKVFSAAKKGILAIRLYDKLSRHMQTIRVREKVRGSTTKVWNQIVERFSTAEMSNLASFERDSLAALDLIAVDSNIQPLHVGMVGEIYVLLEPSVNLGIEERLNYLGCIVERSLYLYDWLCETALPLWLQPKSCQEVMRKSREYIPLCIGGHARQTVGAARDFADRGFDGVVHLMPFACTPEIVSSSILPKIASSQDMPILSLSIDEQTAEVNIQTRLEAFVDLMRGRRQEISR